MKRLIKNNYKIIIGILIGITISVTTVYAVESYIESKKVSYDNKYTDKNDVQDALDELYEKSGIHKNKWTDPILNGADPVLKDPLIPVEIKPNGEVYYANLNSEWYNYSEKRWANAVILIDNPSNENYKVGDHIIEDDIESYFVWIPRYQYKVWSLGKYNGILILDNLTDVNDKSTLDTAFWKAAGNNSRIIDIKFGTVDSLPKMNENEAAIDKYYTHPAFTLGNKNLNGIWVGKFETGGSTADTMVVKPDVYSWRNTVLKTFFDAAKSYDLGLDSHMLKNTEWGAVAYLSHSAYGIGTEINVNNTSDCKTGYSAMPGTNQNTIPGESTTSNDLTKTQPWNTPIGYLASTTGNITGIYDMSGGVAEYVAACMKENSESNSGFDMTTLENEIKNGYVDEYSSTSNITSYNNRILGDATGEMELFYQYYEGNGDEKNSYQYDHSSWYSDSACFVDSSYHWFYRGGLYNEGVIAGQFSFARWNGVASTKYSFRLGLAPQ